MKPFDIELAKAGHPVCTREGNPVRIICFDRKNVKCPMIALIDRGDSEDFVSYIIQGTFYNNGKEHKDDLFMASVKKEGWINLYKDNGVVHTINRNREPFIMKCPDFDNREHWVFEC